MALECHTARELIIHPGIAHPAVFFDVSTFVPPPMGNNHQVLLIHNGVSLPASSGRLSEHYFFFHGYNR